MEEIDFSINYTNGLNDIYFTHLKGGLYGDYDICARNIRLACNNEYLDDIHKILVHEIGHHMDETEGYSDMQELKDELDKESQPELLMSQFTNKPYGPRGDGKYCEYFALGFELYHSHENGLPEKQFPVLFNMIDELNKRIK